MVRLRFAIRSARPIEHAVTPQAALEVTVDSGGAEVRSTLLRCQIRVEPKRRSFGPSEAARLVDLFPVGGSRAPDSVLWGHETVVVPAFSGQTCIDVPLHCTYDMNAAVAKLVHALDDGLIPIAVYFSGTVFYAGPGQTVMAAPISHSAEAHYALPVDVVRAVLQHYFPGTAPLTVPRELFGRLHDFRIAHGIPTIEAALEQLLAHEVNR